jgi:hypothetical protein
MSDRGGYFDDDEHTDGMYSAYSRANSRYGRRHHDQDDRWARHTEQHLQDRD